MKEKLKRLKTILETLKRNKERKPKEAGKESEEKLLYDFDSKKHDYYKKELFSLLDELSSGIKHRELENIKNFCTKDDFEKALAGVSKLESVLPEEAEKSEQAKAAEPVDFGDFSFFSHKIPPEIRTEIEADIHEAKKCFNAACFRSVTILCGRMLETVLFRKYYDVTGNDLIETSPGTGLGKIIAKLKEKNIELNAGLTEQIHLINKVRIYSVHKKSGLFQPTKEQAQAIMLYTVDVLKKVF